MQFEYSQTIRGQAVTGFRPGWWPSIAVALLLPLLLGLGFWQLSRAEEKRALLADFAAREHAEPMSVAELERRADLAHLRIRLRGQFDEQHSLLLDNRQLVDGLGLGKLDLTSELGGRVMGGDHGEGLLGKLAHLLGLPGRGEVGTAVDLFGSLEDGGETLFELGGQLFDLCGQGF